MLGGGAEGGGESGGDGCGGGLGGGGFSVGGGGQEMNHQNQCLHRHL